MTYDATRSSGHRIQLWIRAGWSAGVAFLVAISLCCGAPFDPEATAPAQPNVVIFLLDAARADHIGCYGYARPTTPHIDAFAQTAAIYTQATSDASYTFASASALFTGTSPERSRLLKPRRIGKNLVLFAEIAQAAGYRTHAYSENPFVTSDFGFDRGFQGFNSTLAYGKFLKDLPHFEHSDASAGIDATLRFMEGEPGVPFLAYVHLLRPHNPYTPPEAFAGRFGARPDSGDGETSTLMDINEGRQKAGPRRLQNIVALYDENLAYADAMFGRLLDGMRERNLLDDTVVIVVSDHGEAFLEHDRLLHAATTYEEMIRIPLLVHVPGEKGRVIDRPVQLADLGRALRNLVAGSKTPFEPLTELGRGGHDFTLSWATPGRRRACVRTPTRKLIIDTHSQEAVAYYDLESDPRESTPSPLDREADRLLSWFRKRVRKGQLSLAIPAEFELDPKLVQQLEALGYTEDR